MCNRAKQSNLAAVLPRNQQGATLIIGILMLLLITLVVLAGARSITQESVMANNTRDRDVAFQAAEACLSDAESRIASLHGSFPGVGLLVTTSTDVVERSNANYWITTYGWYNGTGGVDTSKSIEMLTSVAGVDVKPRFVVERLPTVVTCGGGGSDTRYRVTCVATGAGAGADKSADTRIMLQAEFDYCT